MSRELDSDEKLMELGRQIRLANIGMCSVIHCPYCGKDTGIEVFVGELHEAVCCDKFAFAGMAIIERMQQEEKIETAVRALEDAGRAVLN